MRLNDWLQRKKSIFQIRPARFPRQVLWKNYEIVVKTQSVHPPSAASMAKNTPVRDSPAMNPLATGMV